DADDDAEHRERAPELVDAERPDRDPHALPGIHDRDLRSDGVGQTVRLRRPAPRGRDCYASSLFSSCVLARGPRTPSSPLNDERGPPRLTPDPASPAPTATGPCRRRGKRRGAGYSRGQDAAPQPDTGRPAGRDGAGAP